ncbi:MAG TPA: integrin alpha [bacterium]|nr:integrin alpha [bacterium]
MKRVFLLAALVFLTAASALFADFQMDTSLADSDASFLGEAEGDRAGSPFEEEHAGAAVSNAGDVNGDGYDDFLVGAYANDEGGNSAGQTYLFFGKASGWAMDTSLADAAASFIGEANADYAGVCVSGAGDVNGDGYDDFLIGASRNSEGDFVAGQTYLILGKASGWAMDTSLSDSDASFIGEGFVDVSGMSVSGAGDVNGDSYDDFIIGSWNSEPGDYAGQTYLILGKSSGWAMDNSLADSDASFWGESEMDGAGCSVSGAGDVNGDGYDDFVIGAPYNEEGANNAGQTYLIFGKASGWAMDTSLSEADASFIGEREYSWAGWSVSGAGDLNGDGYDDFLIGGEVDSTISGNDDGRTYLILGKPLGWAMDTSLADADGSFLGEADGDRAGFSVSGAGDINDDGYDDFLIGAIYNAGQAYLILGKVSGWAMDTSLADSDASFLGEAASDRAAMSVSGAGDVNGDGADDLLIAAPHNTEVGDDAGQVYLIFGESGGPPPGITVGVTTNSSTYEFDDVLEIDIAVKNTGLPAFVDIFVVLTFDLSGPEERHWSASATGQWTEGIFYYDTGLLVETGHDETTQILSAVLPRQAPMVAKSGTYTLRMVACQAGTFDFVSNLATSTFVLVGEPFVGISTDKETYSLAGDTITVSLDVALPDYSMTADFYVVLLAPGGQFWSPTDFGVDPMWLARVDPLLSGFPTPADWNLEFEAFVVNLPSGAPFDMAGDYTLFAGVVEPGTLMLFSDIGVSGFALQPAERITE